MLMSYANHLHGFSIWNLPLDNVINVLNFFINGLLVSAIAYETYHL